MLITSKNSVVIFSVERKWHFPQEWNENNWSWFPLAEKDTVIVTAFDSINADISGANAFCSLRHLEARTDSFSKFAGKFLDKKK